MDPQPDFYLASSENYDLEEPRKCFRIKRLRGEQRDDYLLIRIDPPISGQPYGFGQDIEKVIVVARHSGYSLFPITEWPVFVHVSVPLVDDPESRDLLRRDEVDHIAWAALYETEEEARRKELRIRKVES